MEFKSEVFILRRFRRLLTLISILFLFAFSSCANYGFYQLLFGEEDVDDRFSGFSDLSGETVLSSSLGLNGKYSFIVVTDVHIGASDVRSSKMNDFLDEISSLFESIDKTKIPRFIVNLGDTADGGHLSEYNDYNSYLEKIRKLAVEKNVVSSTEAFKIYTILGNHDLYNNGWTDWEKIFAWFIRISQRIIFRFLPVQPIMIHCRSAFILWTQETVGSELTSLTPLKNF